MNKLEELEQLSEQTKQITDRIMHLCSQTTMQDQEDEEAYLMALGYNRMAINSINQINSLKIK